MKKKTKFGLLGLAASAALACGLAGCAAEVSSESSSVGGTKDTTPPTITFACNEAYLAALNSRFTIPVEDILVLDDVDEVTPVFSVTFGKETVALSDNSFAVEREGVYTVLVEAADKSGNRAEKTIEVHTLKENEINSFDDAVRVGQAVAKGYAEVSLNTDPQFIKEGTGSLKLQVNTHSALGWPGVIVRNLPINNILDYYSISFWAYNDGKKDVDIILNRNDASLKAKFTLQSQIWTKVEVRARDYDEVFKVMEATAWGEPECGMCEDLKCVTFHLVNPANSPQFDIYVDSLRVNEEAAFDTLDIRADVEHPVVGVKYSMPDVTVTRGGTAVEAQIAYKVFDENYDEVPFTGKEITFAKEGRYTLRVEASYEGLIGRKNYMLIVARTRADNEIEFFESDSALSFFTSETLTLGIDRTICHDANGSTGSLKIGASPSIWPYLTIGNVPHADLNGIAYIYFYAKIDYDLTATQTAYLGLRNGKQNRVLKRMKLSKQWQGYSFTKQQLSDLGIDTLDGLQISVELYDTTDTANDGWVPVAFDTYIDNFTACKEAAPTEKENGVVLDFANYRDLDDIDSSYASYWFFDPAYTLNGVGSMQFSCTDGRWPSMTFGSRFSAYELEYVKNLLLDVYIPEIAAGHTVRIGANNKGYTNLSSTAAGKWITVAIPVSALRNKTVEGEAVVLSTLENVSLTFGKSDGSADINFGTLYIGKVSLEYYDVDPSDKDHVKPAGVLYDFYNFREAEEIKHPAASGEYTRLDGDRTAKLVMSNSAWGKIYLPASADEMVADLTGVSYIYLDIFVDATYVENEYVRFVYLYWNGTKYVEKFFESMIPADEWITVRFPVKEGTAKLSDLYFYFVKYSKTAEGKYDWQAIGTQEGEALYIREIGYTSNETVLRDFDSEGAWSTGIFYVKNDDYVVFRNGNTAFVKEGEYSIGLMAAPRWPAFYFTDAFVDWLEEKGYTSISFDVYIDSVEGNRVTKIEGIGATSAPVNNEWFTVTAQVSALRGKCIQFNHEAANRLFFYIDNMAFNKS